MLRFRTFLVAGALAALTWSVIPSIGQAPIAAPNQAAKPAQGQVPSSAQSQALGTKQAAAADAHATKAATAADRRRAQGSLAVARKAQAAGRFEEALAAFDEAARLDRRSVTALEGGALLRSRLVHERADAAEELALEGKPRQAVEELRSALRVDPGNRALEERLSEVSVMARAAQQATRQEVAGPPAFPWLQPQPGKHSFDVRGDTQSAYQQVAQAFGLKAVFDPDLAARTLRFRANDVDFWTAARILGVQTATFYRAVSADTFLVAADTPAKQKEYQRIVEETIPVGDAVGPEELTELLRVLRDITESQHIQIDSASHSITVRDTPGTVTLAKEVIQQVEQARGELILDIELLEVDRNAALQLGITPPTAVRAFTLSTQDIRAIQQARDAATLIGILQRLAGAQGLLGASGTSLPAVIAFGGGRSTFFSQLPGAAAQFSQALTLVRSGRRVLLRAQDRKPATLFVGDRFPITLSLLSASLGKSSFTPTIGPNLLPRSDFPVGNAPLAVVTGDWNGDGRPDIAVVNHNDSSVSILLNQGNANFREPTGSPIIPGTNQTGGAAIAVGDFNKDSINDLVVVNQTSNNLTVLLGKGDGTFTAATGSPIATGNAPSGIAVADFNGDGHLDLAVTNLTANSVSIFLGDGKGGFKEVTGSPILLPGGVQGPVAIVAADFNNDGKRDLVVVNRTTNNISVLLGNGNGTFTEAPGSPIAVGKTPVAVAAGDLNGDSRPDLAIANQTDNTVTVLLNNGDATFTASGSSPLQTGAKPASVAIADFNGDRFNDLLVANQGADSISVHLGLGAGLFAPRFGLPTAAGPSAVAVADFNGDGRPDAAIAEQTANEVSVILDPVSFGGGLNGALQQPYPGSEYVDLGLKVKATPVLHPNDEVTLQLEFEIRALSGQSVNGIPILSNRTLSQTIRVRANETTLIGGLLDTEETRSLSGLPGFSGLPGAGFLTSARNKQNSDTQLLILVTPRQLRLPRRSSRPIYAGRGGTGAGPPGARPSEVSP